MYEDHSHFYLILDLVNGGEMFDHLSNDVRLYVLPSHEISC